MHDPVLLTIILQAVGVAVIIAEFLIPSAGLLTVAAIGIFGYSLYIVFSQTTVMIGVVFLLADLALVPVLVFFGVLMLGKSPMALRQSLRREDGVTSQDAGLQHLVGLSGTVISPCRPAGRALIEGKKYDVVSAGDFFDNGVDIVVTEVNGNRIVVAAKNS